MSSVDGPTLTRALVAWRQAIGSSSVSAESEILQAAGTATFATTRQVLAILRPADRAQVQECVRIANQFRVPLYPISTGKNWGYGSRAPVEDGVLLDLSRLNRILDFDETLAYVTVEPGVTQKQLYEFLQVHGSRLWMDATGASPECSIIGNTLERGFGHTPMGDHCSHVCGLEVVLSSGEILETGLARFPGAAAAPLNRWGVGPSLDGLFSQSNLGIVTRMSVWLMPAPEYFQAYYFQCEDADGVAGIIDALRPLRLDGTIRSTAHIGNDYKVLSSMRQYPWKEMDGKTPLDPTVKNDICRDLRIASWSGSGGLYGTRAQVRAARTRLRSALRGKVSRLVFVDDGRLRLMRRFATPFRLLTGLDVKRTIGLMMPLHGLLKGIPTEAPLSSTYWRKKSPAPEHPDPDRDGCGLIWCSPVLPNTGTKAREVACLIDEAVLSHGFEPMMSFSLVSDRAIVCVAMIGYDREVAGEDERAFECHRTLTKHLIDRGYPPYRLNVRSMNDLDDDTTYLAVLQSLKSALDPKGILAPGRYEPGLPAAGVADRPATLAG
jgi:4-cresol dehydrogenase (hydroxylating)